MQAEIPRKGNRPATLRDAKVTIWKAVQRLIARGLVNPHVNIANRYAGVKLSDEGKAAAETITANLSAKRPTSKPLGETANLLLKSATSKPLEATANLAESFPQVSHSAMRGNADA